MAGNHVLLETIDLTQSASSVTFDNIPQTGYTDLKIVMSCRTSGTGSAGAGYQERVNVYFNGTTTSYSERWIQAEGGTTVNSGTTYFNAAGSNGLAGTTVPSDWTANTFNNTELYIPNYNSTSTYKSWSVDAAAENNGSFGSLMLAACLWSNNSAITTIAISPKANSWVTGSTFSLYGVAATGATPTIAPKATGGNMVSTDGTYWYHTFFTSGTFTPQTALTCDYLVVAGGGGGGSSNSVGGRGAGGGGAGGYRHFTSQLFAANTSYTAVIGAGGAPSTQGSATSFNSISATGGGYGGASDVGGANSGGPGGSGGGAGQHPGTRNGGAGNAGSYSPVEGYAGTTVNADSPEYGGGNGGGSSGTMSYATTPPTPTNGTANSISGTSITYATGGQGGAGNGNGATGAAGSANTGNGGGGGAGKGSPYQNTPGGAGGSGIVIIRYAMA